MPTTPTYPGLYPERIPSGVRTITGVSTSVAAFIGYFTRGSINKAVQIFSPGDLEREFGGLNSRSEASYAIQQFFLNGGSEAWVVRTASGDIADATVNILAEDGSTAFIVRAGKFDSKKDNTEAINPGIWGNRVRIGIDYPLPDSSDRFNLTVSLVELVDGKEVVLQTEDFNGLTMTSVENTIDDEFSGSKLVRITDVGSSRPQLTGTVSGLLTPFPNITNPNPQLVVNIGTDEQGVAKLSKVPGNLQEARGLLESAIRSARPELKSFAQAQVSIVDDRLRVLAGSTTADSQITFAEFTGDSTVEDLGLLSGTTVKGIVSGNLNGVFGSIAGQLNITIGDSNSTPLNLEQMNNLEAARTELETKIRGASVNAAPEDADAFSQARVVIREQQLIVLAGLPDKNVSFAPANADTTVDDLGLQGASATPVSALISEIINPIPLVVSDSSINISIDNIGPHAANTTEDADDLNAIATELENAIRAADPALSPPFTSVRVATSNDNQLIIVAEIAGDIITVPSSNTDSDTVSQLKLDDAGGVTVNVQNYALGTETAGADGDLPDASALIGEKSSKSGMYALLDVDLFNILCIPRTAIISGGNALDTTEAFSVLATAKNFCEERRAFLLIDTPTGINEVQEIKDWLNTNNGLRSPNAALYFPRVLTPDPLNDFKLRSVGASGTIAGMYARIDSDRGVWKAPAGTEATLSNVFKLETKLTDAENGTLNPIAINCLRTFPIYGTICWGARTLDGADAIGSEYKYVPVSRLALFIEETLFRGLKWVVFEPNDEPLWSQIRLNVGAFMNTLFRQGAFQGKTPNEAYRVKCDGETTTQNDIDRGIVNIVVGFAPLKPAEFVFIKLQQLAGQIQT